jgi:SAM-dependent methyltransferase
MEQKFREKMGYHLRRSYQKICGRWAKARRIQKLTKMCVGQDYFLPYMLKFHFDTLLDIGMDLDAYIIDFFIKNKKTVYAIDFKKWNSYQDENFHFIEGNFLDYAFSQKFDAVLASHVLEHVQNTGLFLDKVYEILKDDGIFFCIVPPHKTQIVGGHVKIGWNMGILMYNLILCGFNVKAGRFKKHGYNIAAFVKKRGNKKLPEGLLFDAGDLEKLADYWPDKSYFRQNFEGDIGEWNWFKENATLAKTKDSLAYLYSLKPLDSREDSLDYAIKNLEHRHLDWAEFGVWKGDTAKFLLKRLPKNNSLYLFDSFKGLPETWFFQDGRVWKDHREGYFAIPEKDIPKFEDYRIKMKIGWFEDCLPQFVKEHDHPLGLIHVDCDIYASTKQIFDSLNELIIQGTIIVFDEYYNYDVERAGWMDHEYKAFQEFVKNKRRKYEYLARTNEEQVVIKILK